MQVKELTVEELKLLIQETVAETIQSILLDPDQDKEVKPEVKQQVLDSLRRIKLVMAYFVEFSREAIADLEALAPII
jgi:hypothetical protein